MFMGVSEELASLGDNVISFRVNALRIKGEPAYSSFSISILTFAASVNVELLFMYV